MLKEEWSEWDERHRRQSCEGSSERVRAVSVLKTIYAVERGLRAICSRGTCNLSP
jgi:hypothetical protein